MLRHAPGDLPISEDDWTSNLFSGELKIIEDYGRCSAVQIERLSPTRTAFVIQATPGAGEVAATDVLSTSQTNLGRSSVSPWHRLRMDWRNDGIRLSLH
jgi:hypothetical protein